MKLLGVIPARGNSKRLPNKNRANLGGKPLVLWTLEAAIESGVFEIGWLWVSSEDNTIGEIAKHYWWLRDPILSRDDTPSLDVVLEVYKNHHQSADAVMLLQPTSPFRTAEDIKKALDLFNKCNADVVIGVTEGQRDLAFQIRHANRLILMPEIMVPNGSIYIIRSNVLDADRSWYDGPAVYGYVMPKQRSIDIDIEQDLMLARYMLENGIISDPGSSKHHKDHSSEEAANRAS